ncbi:ribokinase [Caldanaerobacter subterraneus subsp. tengcongensis MB4]|uniref:Ribokinase n=3 Tax=Caldanaerobacter subterraneus TaxID=911092 RepID=Q8RD45_CALS4|nr:MULTISPECIES: ribokinase [Caldanaerobacter]AAM23503.1 Sugar kinases, ribokinase family [Caldanaerobacter subterraneus subsp. tengcongensis MB4]ERM92616.1 ribokinase [Caldanaerobacter subterraneus subsp. yonseiensis KB-1]KKC30767.1 ribokinase family sugar kinase [Caldanaerobacter subterraneus subsp. pacificus DSM 12653]MCS3917018.1 ribokinase [Caldanaerobacter subterraneus subsp. tengcongensis MB4]MDI3519262.1 ribokinase [Caldanaerobacter sp.]
MRKIVVVGSINMDIVIRVPRIPVVGETVIAYDLKNYGGGKGANQAVSIARLGGNVSMIGRVGNDEYGQKLYRDLKSNGVGVEGIEFDSETPTGTAYINVSEKGENNIVVYQGANKRLNMTQIKRYEHFFDEAEICLLQLEIPIETVKFVVDLCYSRGIKVILNPAPAYELPDTVLEKVYILTPNETELAFLSKSKIETIEDIRKASKYLLDKGVQNVITTIGEKGSYFINKNTEKLFDAIKVTAVDTTAAGDSFTGALAFALSKGEKIEDAIRFATFVAALTVTKEGAQTSLPYKEEVEKFIKERS